jgi:hypothetical protein
MIGLSENPKAALQVIDMTRFSMAESTSLNLHLTNSDITTHNHPPARRRTRRSAQVVPVACCRPAAVLTVASVLSAARETAERARWLAGSAPVDAPLDLDPPGTPGSADGWGGLAGPRIHPVARSPPIPPAKQDLVI